MADPDYVAGVNGIVKKKTKIPASFLRRFDTRTREKIESNQVYDPTSNRCAQRLESKVKSTFQLELEKKRLEENRNATLVLKTEKSAQKKGRRYSLYDSAKPQSARQRPSANEQIGSNQRP